MAEQHIIINDTTDDVLPLAWGVKGGNVTAHNLTVQPANGSSNANIRVTNTSIIANGNFSMFTSDSNDTISISGPGGVVLGGGKDVSLSCGGNVSISGGGTTYISSGSGYNTTITSGNVIVLSAGNIQVSTGNFGVMGPATFTASVNFNSSTNFSSTSSYTAPLFVNNTNLNLNNGGLVLSNNTSFSMNANSRFDVNSSAFTLNGVGESMIQTTDGNITLTAGGSNGTTIVQGGGNGIRMTGSQIYVSSGNCICAGPTYVNAPITVANSSMTQFYGSFQQFNGYRQFISNQVISAYKSGVNTANFAYNTRKPNIMTANVTMSLGLINPNIAVVAGSLKSEAIINSDNTVFTKLQYIDNSTIISNNTANIAYTTSTPLFFVDPNVTTIMDSRVANIPISGNIVVDTLDDNTVVEFSAYTENQDVRTSYQFNPNNDIALYVALMDNSEDYYNIVLLQGYNDSCLDDGENHCFVKLKDLLEKDDTTHLTNVTLDSTWKFRIIGVCGTGSRSIANNFNIYYEYKIYEPIIAGSGGGSSINEDNLYEPYSNLSTYAVNDLAIYNNILYKCIVPVTTPESFDSNKWVNTSLSDEITTNTNSLGGLKLVQLTQQEYDSLSVYDNHTLYVIANVVS